mmetsp:Transcript_20538/g.23700  ORF Transcript_20538/g.23700 Transcript_20538/m.23700 type:complete len:209 (-) Transcript_20538:2959-3585(-)
MVTIMMHRRYFGNSARAFSSMKSNVITFTMLEEKADTIMKKLSSRGETVGTAETSSGGLISASLFSSPVGSQCFKGGGIRLAYGINRDADERGKSEARNVASKWGILYENGVQQSDTGSMEHALEIAHAAKFNLHTTWGIGESGIPGPDVHRRSGLPPGMGFVAVAGPTEETTGVVKLNPSGRSRSENMMYFTKAALDLFLHLQSKER